MPSAIHTPSPIREQTAFMAALTALRTEYESNMAALYASQREYKEAFSLVETVKEFGFGDLDYMEIWTTFHHDGVMKYVEVKPGDLDTLYKAMKIAGVVFTTSLSPSARRLFIEVPGYPRLSFMAHPEMTTIEVTECVA